MTFAEITIVMLCSLGMGYFCGYFDGSRKWRIKAREYQAEMTAWANTAQRMQNRALEREDGP